MIKFDFLGLSIARFQIFLNLVHNYLKDKTDQNWRVYTNMQMRKRQKPVERGSPLGWPAGGGQLELTAVSLFHICLKQGNFFSKSFFINFYDFFRISFFKISWGERKSEVAS
jgi:hypothetical protein